MKHITCRVAGTVGAFGTRRVVTLSAEDLPRMRAGQLVLVRVHDTLEPYLPSAYFPLPAGAGNVGAARMAAGGGAGSVGGQGELALLVEGDDPVGQTLGEVLEVIAPIGNGFTLDAATRRLLLVGEAAWLAPLIALAHEASQKQIAVSLLVGTKDEGGRRKDEATAEGRSLAGTKDEGGTMKDEATAEGRSLAAWLSEMLPLDVEYQVSAELDAVLPALLGWADQVCAAGDGALYARLKGSPGLEGRMRRVGGRTHAFHPAARNTGPFGHTGKAAFGNPKGPSIAPAVAQVVVAPLMACGSGACQGCAVETEQGMRLACVEGPVFDLAELL